MARRALETVRELVISDEVAGAPSPEGNDASPARARWPWIALFTGAVLWSLILLHRGQPLGWDEIEFYRATRWTAEGRVPFRDFWEHHTPLQWMMFAPVALVADGAGADSIVAMRRPRSRSNAPTADSNV